MNVLVATTLGHNPGDDFIRMGCLHLFEQSFPGSHNYLYYNRNPDLMVQPPYSEMRPQQWGNYVTDIDDSIDMVLIAGSPEWNGAPLGRIYNQLFERLRVPVIALGVGISSSTPRLSSQERLVLSSSKALITTRSRGGAQWFAEQGILGVKEIPCPAVFCGGPISVGRIVTLRVIVQKPGYGFQEVEPQLISDDLKVIGNPLAFHHREFTYFTNRWGKGSIAYTADPAAALRAIASSRRVLSTRLHGAIAALAHDVPACILVDHDERINLTCDLFPSSILPRIKSASELASVAWASPHAIHEFRVDVRKSYFAELGAFRQKIGVL